MPISSCDDAAVHLILTANEAVASTGGQAVRIEVPTASQLANRRRSGRAHLPLWEAIMPLISSKSNIPTANSCLERERGIKDEKIGIVASL